MLKIKDNIELKELEKYGFKKDTYYIGSDYYSYRKVLYEEDKRGYGNYEYLMIEIDLDGEIVMWGTVYKKFIDIDVLYDLIQAGLVEKVW